MKRLIYTYAHYTFCHFYAHFAKLIPHYTKKTRYHLRIQIPRKQFRCARLSTSLLCCSYLILNMTWCITNEHVQTALKIVKDCLLHPPDIIPTLTMYISQYLQIIFILCIIRTNMLNNLFKN